MGITNSDSRFDDEAFTCNDGYVARTKWSQRIHSNYGLTAREILQSCLVNFVPKLFDPPRYGRSAYNVPQPPPPPWAQCVTLPEDALHPPPGLLVITEEADSDWPAEDAGVGPADAAETEAADGACESSAGLATSPAGAGETEAADGAGESSAGLATNEASMAQLPAPETEAAGDSAASWRPRFYPQPYHDHNECKQQ